MNPINGSYTGVSDNAGEVVGAGDDAAQREGRPGSIRLLAIAVVALVIGGFALSRDYGVPGIESVPVQRISPDNLPPIETTASTSTTLPSTVLVQSEPFDSPFPDWMSEVTDIAVGPYGEVFAASPAGVAWRGDVGGWELIAIDALPVGTGGDAGWANRYITHVAAAGPDVDVDGFMWVAGHATSSADDEEFGGVLNGWTGGRVLDWVARYHCPICNEWTVWTTNRVPELAGGIGDLVVSSDGVVYASVGQDLLMLFDGQAWTSVEVPLPEGGDGVVFPWSSSLAVDHDGVLWAGTNYANGGVLRFDGTEFTRYTTEDGLPSDHAFRVAAGEDGTIWVATDVLYGEVRTAPPDEAAGVAAFDGTTWTTYTMEDGLLSNDAEIATGDDGTVWAVHGEIPPYGYSKFDGSGWTAYPYDSEVGGYRAEVDSDGTLWTISDEGLVSFDGTTRTVHPSPFVQSGGSFWLTPVRWEIIPEADWGPGVYTVFMEMDARPLTGTNVDDVSGRLIWDETVVDLCGIGFDRGNGFLQIGDIFHTTEGCGSNPTAMQEAFDEFDLPEQACLTVVVSGLDHEYCAPLPDTDDVSVETGRGAIRVSLEGLEGFESLAVDAWVVPIDPSDEGQRLGGVHFGLINEEPFSASDLIRQDYLSVGPSKVAMFEPGTYRFIIEAYVPSGDMHYGCEMPIQVVDGQPSVMTFTSLPAYTDSGIHWTPLDELEYPDCPG